MIKKLKEHWPIIVAIGVLWFSLIVLLLVSLGRNQGHLVYVLDDAYIHMSMAKNFARHGVWGVTRYGFTSSSSSPLWTLLLSLIYLLVGVNEVTPFILNLFFSTVAVFLAYVILRKYGLPPFFNFAMLLSLIFVTPMTALIFSGMEHSLHILITILFACVSAELLAKQKIAFSESKWPLILLAMLAPLLTLVRYEGIFLVFVVTVLFFIRRKPAFSLSLLGLGILPIVGYGMISTSKGWFFLPNSVLLKINAPLVYSSGAVGNFLASVYVNIINNRASLFLIIGLLIVFMLDYRNQGSVWKDSQILIIILVGTALLHMQFARMGYFYRYEAYLVALGILTLGISTHGYIPEKFSIKIDMNLTPKTVATAVLIAVLLLPYAKRTAASLINTPQATKNTHEQQYQMGLFLRGFYRGRAVAMNDIGAVNYFADIRCFDVWGLADVDVATSVELGSYTTIKAYSLAKQKNVKIAVLYEDCLGRVGGIPPQWKDVGQWTILNNVVCGGQTVTFYAIEPSETDALIRNLRAFSARLPRDVVQTGKYTSMGNQK